MSDRGTSRYHLRSYPGSDERTIRVEDDLESSSSFATGNLNSSNPAWAAIRPPGGSPRFADSG